MTKHWPVYDGYFATHCKCGYGQGVSFGRYDDDADVHRHVDNERDKERAAVAAEKERVRLLTQGQNWDQP